MKTVSTFLSLDDLAGVGIDTAHMLVSPLTIMPMMGMGLLVTLYALIGR